MVISKISPSFNVAIPKEIRLALNLQPGDALEFYIQEDGSIILKKEVALDHDTAQVILPAFEWVYEDEEEEFEESAAKENSYTKDEFLNV